MNSNIQDSYFSICIELHSNITSKTITTNWFIVNNKMTFAEFKNLLIDHFKIYVFSISFVSMYLDSEDIKLNDKTLDYFLFKNASKIILVSKYNEHIIEFFFTNEVSNIDISTYLKPLKLKRSISSYKYMEGHYISYKINKPVIISTHYQSNYIHIITPNGSMYEGNINKTYNDLMMIGYEYNSFATDDEICDIYKSPISNESYYLF